MSLLSFWALKVAMTLLSMLSKVVFPSEDERLTGLERHEGE